MDKTESLLRERLHGVNTHTDTLISRRHRCIRTKYVTTTIKSHLVSITTTYHIELVGMECLTDQHSRGGYDDLMVTISKLYVPLPSTRTKLPTQQCTRSFNQFMAKFGLSAKIQSVHGCNVRV